MRENRDGRRFVRGNASGVVRCVGTRCVFSTTRVSQSDASQCLGFLDCFPSRDAAPNPSTISSFFEQRRGQTCRVCASHVTEWTEREPSWTVRDQPRKS
eukprot:444002-Prymnesium_polylepis.1